MDMNAAYTGFTEQREKRNRQRRELAQAFQEFQRANPEATVQDFQMFIDSMAGSGLGSNYVRGGAPSLPILQSLAEQGAARKAQRLQEQASANFRRRAENLSTLEAMADRAVLGMDGENFDAAYEDFVSSLGPYGQGIIKGMNLRNRFTPQNRELLQGRRLMESMPQIENYLNMINYELGEVDAETMGRFFGLPASEMTMFVDAAKKKVMLKQQEWRQTNNAYLMQVARDAAASGDKSAVKKAITTVLAGTQFGDQFIKDFDFTPYEAEADRVLTERERASEERAQAALAQFRTMIKNDRDIERFIASGNRERALQLIKSYATQYLTDVDIAAEFGVSDISKAPASVFENILDERVQLLRDAQDETYMNSSRAIGQQVQQLRAQGASSNVEQLTNILKTAIDDNIAGQLGLAFGGMDGFYATESLARAIIEINNALPPEILEASKDPEQGGGNAVIEYIRQELAGNPAAIPFRDALNAQEAKLEERSGIFRPVEFQTYLDTERDQLVETIEAARSDFRTVQGLDPSTTEGRNQIGTAITQIINNLRQAHGELVRETDQRRTSRLEWVYGNSGYDVTKFQSDVVAPSERATNEFIADLENWFNNLPPIPTQETPPVDPSDIQADKLDETGTVVGSALNDWGAKTMANVEIRSAAGFATDGTWLGMPQGLIGKPFQFVSDMFSSEAEYERRLGMRDYVESIQDRLNEYGSLLLQNGRQQDFRAMLSDIQNLTAEQFDQKYKAALERLASQRTIEGNQ